MIHILTRVFNKAATKVVETHCGHTILGDVASLSFRAGSYLVFDIGVSEVFKPGG